MEIRFSSTPQAKAALNALIPDNVKFPKGLTMRMSAGDSTLTLQLQGEDVRATTILSTLDEVIEHAYLAKKVMSG
ncbi:MAG TPA: KEOPS complex subunit Pcc1 [Nitrososphaera sp.]|nr:KEOPS complex subunit Pcc1 [Nitrososphaera sp.]